VIVVDTSVWIDAIRKPDGDTSVVLRQLIDTDEAGLALPVRFELLTGIRRENRAPFRRALTALPVLVPSEDTWRLIESWIEPAADAGRHFAVTDLLIAGLAHEIGALVWSTDVDFRQMAALGFVQLYR
jgi:predicted nucleic acid-binding protein